MKNIKQLLIIIALAAFSLSALSNDYDYSIPTSYRYLHTSTHDHSFGSYWSGGPRGHVKVSQLPTWIYVGEPLKSAFNYINIDISNYGEYCWAPGTQCNDITPSYLVAVKYSNDARYYAVAWGGEFQGQVVINNFSELTSNNIVYVENYDKKFTTPSTSAYDIIIFSSAIYRDREPTNKKTFLNLSVRDLPLTTATTSYCADADGVLVSDFISYSDDREIIKQFLRDGAGFLSISCPQNSNAISGTNDQIYFNPGSFSYSDYNPKSASLIFSLFGRDYTKNITINPVMDNIDHLVHRSEYKINITQLSASGSNLKTLIHEQFGSPDLQSSISISDYAAYSSGSVLEYGTELSVFYDIILPTGPEHCVENDIKKRIKVTLVEDRLDLSSIVTSSQVTWTSDNTFELSVCQGDDDVSFKNLIHSDYHSGGAFNYELLLGDNTLSQSEAITGNGSSNAKGQCDKVGSYKMSYRFSKTLNSIKTEYRLYFIVHVMEKPLVSSTLTNVCEAEDVFIKELISISPSSAVIKSFKVNNSTENFETFLIPQGSYGDYAVELLVANHALSGCFTEFSKTIHVNSRVLDFSEKNISVCSSDAPIDFSALLSGGSSGGVYKLDGLPFDGVFNPGDPDYSIGVYNVTYSENAGYCRKTATATVNLTGTPQIDDYVGSVYSVPMSTLARIGGTEADLINYVNNQLIGNSHTRVRHTGTWNINAATLYDLGRTFTLNFRATMSADISACVNSDVSKDFTISIYEDRFDLANELATVRLGGRHDVLYLCSSKDDYNLNNLFVAAYQGGHFEQINFVDYDGNPNNNEDLIISKTGLLSLDRPLKIFLRYRYTKDDYTDEFPFYVSVMPAVDAAFTNAVQSHYCEDARFSISENVVSFGTGDILGTKINGEAADLFDTKILGNGTHQISVTVGNEAKCEVTKTKQIHVNTATPEFVQNAVQLCTGSSKYDFSKLLTGTYLTGTYKLDGRAFGGIFDPKANTPGTYTVSYTESDDYCSKTTEIELELLEMPAMDTYVADAYTLTLGELEMLGGTQKALLEHLSKTINNEHLTLSHHGAWMVDLSKLYASGSVMELTLKATLDKAFSDCLYQDLHKNIKVNLVENRFDLINELASTRLSGRGDTLFLCENGDDFDLKNLFSDSFRSGTFYQNYLTDNDSDPNNDEQQMLSKAGLLSLERPYLISATYRYTQDDYTDEFPFYVSVMPEVQLSFSGVQDLYCENADFKISDKISTHGTGSIVSASINGKAAEAFNTRELGDGEHLLSIYLENRAGCGKTFTKTVKVSATALAFDAEKKMLRDGDWTSFTANISGASSYRWDFSDNDYSLQAAPAKYFYLNWEWLGWNAEQQLNEYRVTGDNRFDVTLTLEKDGCTKSLTKENLIEVWPQLHNDFLVNDEGVLKKARLKNGRMELEILQAEEQQQRVWYASPYSLLHIEGFERAVDLSVYAISGVLIKTFESVEEKVFLPLRKGVYFVLIENSTYKIIVK